MAGDWRDERGKCFRTHFANCREGQIFLSIASPKSTDIPAMIAIFSKCDDAQCRMHRCQICCEQYACELAASQIAAAIERLARAQRSAEIIASGGGIENRCLMEAIRAIGSSRSLRITDEFGIPSAAKEALALRCLLGAATLTRWRASECALCDREESGLWCWDRLRQNHKDREDIAKLTHFYCHRWGTDLHR